jgi:hypothetical protein
MPSQRASEAGRIGRTARTPTSQLRSILIPVDRPERRGDGITCHCNNPASVPRCPCGRRALLEQQHGSGSLSEPSWNVRNDQRAVDRLSDETGDHEDQFGGES